MAQNGTLYKYYCSHFILGYLTKPLIDRIILMILLEL